MRTFHKYSLSCSGRHSSRRSSHNILMTLLKATEKCDLCGIPLQQVIKYNQSKRFYYARDIDDLLSNHHTPATILTKDLLQKQQSTECLRLYRPVEDYNERLKSSCQYFKYFKDLPRYPMEDQGGIIRKHYEAHRILEYNKLKHVLKLEEEVFNSSRPRKSKAIHNSESNSFILKEINSMTNIKPYNTNAVKSSHNEQEETLEGLRLQLSQLISNMEINSKNKLPLKTPAKFCNHSKRRSSMPDCSEISSIQDIKPKQTKKATRSQEDRQLTINNWTSSKPLIVQKPSFRQLKTTTSPLKFQRPMKNSRNLRSECSEDKSRLKTYKRSTQTFESNYESINKRQSTKMSPHNISQAPFAFKQYCKSPSARRSTLKNPTSIKPQRRVTHTRISSQMTDPVYRKLQIYCPKNPIQIAISNNNCISIFLQQKKSQAVNPFKKKLLR